MELCQLFWKGANIAKESWCKRVKKIAEEKLANQMSVWALWANQNTQKMKNNRTQVNLVMPSSTGLPSGILVNSKALLASCITSTASICRSKREMLETFDGGGGPLSMPSRARVKTRRDEFLIPGLSLSSWWLIENFALEGKLPAANLEPPLGATVTWRV